MILKIFDLVNFLFFFLKDDDVDFFFFEKWMRYGQMPQFDNQYEFLRNFIA